MIDLLSGLFFPFHLFSWFHLIFIFLELPIDNIVYKLLIVDQSLFVDPALQEFIDFKGTHSLTALG